MAASGSIDVSLIEALPNILQQLPHEPVAIFALAILAVCFLAWLATRIVDGPLAKRLALGFLVFALLAVVVLAWRLPTVVERGYAEAESEAMMAAAKKGELSGCEQPSIANLCAEIRPQYRRSFEDDFNAFVRGTGLLSCRGDTETTWFFAGRDQFAIKHMRYQNCPNNYVYPQQSDPTTPVSVYAFTKRGDAYAPAGRGDQPAILPTDVIDQIVVVCFREYIEPMNWLYMPANVMSLPESTFAAEVNIRTSDLVSREAARDLRVFEMSLEGPADPTIRESATARFSLFDPAKSRFISLAAAIDGAWSAQQPTGQCQPEAVREALSHFGQQSDAITLSVPRGPADHQLMVFLRRVASPADAETKGGERPN